MNSSLPVPQTAAPKDVKHFAYLDAMRGLAFLGVLVVHVGYLSPHLPGKVALLTDHGRMGVQLFFVVSALTLMMSVRSRASREQNPTRNFFIRRFFRIAPLFWFGVVFYTLLYGFHPRHWAPWGIGWTQVVATTLFMQGWHPAWINSVVPGSWSVAAEMTFYLFVPWLAARLSNLRDAIWAAFVALMGSIVVNYLCSKALGHQWAGKYDYLFSNFLYYWFPAQIPIFLIGFVTYFWMRSEGWKRVAEAPSNPKSMSLLLLGLAAFLMVAFTFGNPNPYANINPYVPEHIVFGLAFMLLVMSVSLHAWPLLVNRFTCYMGTISFSCYLCHFFVVYDILEPRFPQIAGRLHLTTHPLLYLVAYLIVACLLTALFATVTYRLIEVPGMQMGRNLIARKEARS